MFEPQEENSCDANSALKKQEEKADNVNITFDKQEKSDRDTNTAQKQQGENLCGASDTYKQQQEDPQGMSNKILILYGFE